MHYLKFMFIGVATLLSISVSNAGCTGCGDDYTNLFERQFHISNFNHRVIIRIEAKSLYNDTPNLELLYGAVIHSMTSLDQSFEFSGADCMQQIQVIFDKGATSSISDVNICEMTSLLVTKDAELQVLPISSE